jgi:hypothetical protein
LAAPNVEAQTSHRLQKRRSGNSCLPQQWMGFYIAAAVDHLYTILVDLRSALARSGECIARDREQS